MISSASEIKPCFRQTYFPSVTVATNIQFDDEMMRVFMSDGRVVSVPIMWYLSFHEATPEQRQDVKEFRPLGRSFQFA